jgi:hypothetical protein
VLADRRVSVYVNDGRQHLQTRAEGAYDLITLEPPPIAHAGVASLYTREFYALARDRLTDGGWLTQWLPAYQLPADRALSLVRAFVDIFPDAVLLVGADRELILAGVKGGPARLDVDRATARLASLPAVERDLARVGFDGVSGLVATFAADGSALRAASAGVPPMTDDWPIAESSRVSHVAVTAMPAALFAPERFASFAPSLAHDPGALAAAHQNAARWSSPEFLSYTTLPPARSP